MAEHLATPIGGEAQRAIAGIGVLQRLGVLAQADQITFLQIEELALVQLHMQQAIIDQIQVGAVEVGAQITHLLERQCLACRRKASQQLRRECLKPIDPCVGVSRLLPK